MMRFLNFRRELALLICPELGAGMAAQDAPILPLTDVLAARKRWLEDERSAAGEVRKDISGKSTLNRASEAGGVSLNAGDQFPPERRIVSLNHDDKV